MQIGGTWHTLFNELDATAWRETGTYKVVKTRVVIIDDVAHVREGLRDALQLNQEIEVVGEAADGQGALEVVAECRPDVVLMDARMPVMDGIQATSAIKHRWPLIRVVVLTVHSQCRQEALAAGADEFVTKGCPVEELLAAVSNPAAG